MLKRWLRYLWTNDDGFFGIGFGPSSQESSIANSLQGVGTFATGEGEGDILASDQFWKSILSGDPSQISKVLGPQESAINKQGQQQKKTAAEFGNRSGGTNAAMQNVDDKTRTSIDSMISQLTGTAAGALGSSGAGLLSTGTGALGSAFSAANTIHGQNQAKWNDIFQSTASLAAAPFTGGASLGMGQFSLPGGGGGGGTAQNQGPYADPGDFTDLGI